MGKRLLVFLAVTACTRPDDFDASSVVISINTSIVRSTESPILTISQVNNSFAGYFCEDGNLVLLQTNTGDLASQPQAADLVDDDVILSCANGTHAPQVALRNATYNYLTLRTWRDGIFDDFFELDGAVKLGIDFRRNRLLGTVTESAVAAATDLMTIHQIPTNAYELTTGLPAKKHIACPDPSYGTDITSSCFRPVPAGVRIQSCPSGGCGIGAGCTLGSANDRYLPEFGRWQGGFITNSHCIPPQFDMQSDWMMQPVNNDQMFSFEYVDPPGWPCGGRICRNSDAAWAYAYDSLPEWGTIARLTFWDGSKSVDSNYPRFIIIGERSPIQGMKAEHSGITTGWSYGDIIQVCVDVAQEGGTTVLCQSEALYINQPGDSGAPVFNWPARTGGPGAWSNNQVYAVGINWGLAPNSVFSPWGQIRADLGTLYINYPCIVAAMIGTLSCTDEAPIPERPITTVSLTFTSQDDRNSVVATYYDPDGAGGTQAAVDDIVLPQGMLYSMSIEISKRSDRLTSSIRKRGDEYQLFFTGSGVNGPASATSQAPLIQDYSDADSNLLPIGLINSLQTAAAGSGQMRVTLFHFPVVDGSTIKTSTLANDVKDFGIESIPGFLVFSIEFSVRSF